MSHRTQVAVVVPLIDMSQKGCLADTRALLILEKQQKSLKR